MQTLFKHGGNKMLRRVIKVFLGSPGDLQEERATARQVVDEENRNHAHEQGYQIELVGWEDTIAQARRAQEAINRDLDQCECFVGLMWQKWGTPPGLKGHPYTSGFEEEFRRSVDRRTNTNIPEISLLFKVPSRDRIEDPGEEIKKVLQFKKEIADGKEYTYQEFESLRDFEQKFRSIISLFLRQHIRKDSPQKDSPSEEEDSLASPVIQSSQPAELLFEPVARAFLLDLISKEAAEEKVEAASVARLRLLAGLTYRNGNDIVILGVHDANLIFRRRNSWSFTDIEIRGLISAALENLRTETIPIWHWLNHEENRVEAIATFRTIFGSDTQKISAFRLMSLSGIQTDSIEMPLNMGIDEFWFGESVSHQVKIAAFEFLQQNGCKNDLETIKPFLNSSDANLSRAAVSTTISILATISITSALEFISSRDDAIPSKNVIKLFVSAIGTIKTDMLKLCLANRAVDFRRIVANELLQRNELTVAEATQLSESNDAETRLIGVFGLKSNLVDISVSDVKRIIVKPKPYGGLSLLSGGSDLAGEAAFQKYQIENLRSTPFNKLKELAAAETVFERVAQLALFSFHFPKMRTEMAEHLKDGFSSLFAARHADVLKIGVKLQDSTLEYLRKEMVQECTEIFCRHTKRSDLALVRDILNRNAVSYAFDIANFLGSYGDWTDLERITAISSKIPFVGFSLISADDHSDAYRTLAKAILKLGSRRIADTLDLKIATEIKVEIIRLLRKAQFELFDDAYICRLLADDQDAVRKSVALKVVVSLSRIRIQKILEKYYDVSETYYYNVIFWLDLGSSVEARKSREIARRALA